MKTNAVSLLTACFVIAPALYAQDHRSTSSPREQIASQITIKRPSKALSKTLDEAGESRVNLDQKEAVKIHLNLAATDGEVRIEAPNGGSLNRQRAAIRVDAARAGGKLDFDFAVGAAPGRYTVEIHHKGATETLEFWAGKEPPTGLAGPPLHFSGKQNQEETK